jgi:arsenate reductase-like glutaredoxin family protein
MPVISTEVGNVKWHTVQAALGKKCEILSQKFLQQEKQLKVWLKQLSACLASLSSKSSTSKNKLTKNKDHRG